MMDHDVKGRPFRWLFIGSGRIANKIAGEIMNGDRHELAFIYSRNGKTAEKLAKEKGATRVDEIAKEVLSRVDGVYVATPHSSHYEIARKCIEMSATPLFVEKPFAVNALEAQMLFDMAANSGILIGEAMCMLYHPLMIRLKERLKEIGEIKRIEIVHAIPIVQILRLPRLTDVRFAGGALLELGVYAISLLSYLFGKVPDNMEATGRMHRGVDYGERLQLFYNGVSCDVNISMDTFGGRPTAKIFATDGTIIISKYSNPLKLTISKKRKREIITCRDSGYSWEFDRFANIVMGRDRSFLDQMNLYTMLTMQTLDLCRRKMGLSYPNDTEF